MKEVEHSAFLLHSRQIRDNKVIAEFLTKDQGKVSAIAYVGKSLKSSKKALLQPFQPLNVVLKGRNSLSTISRIETSEKSFALYGDYLYSGFYLNELQVRLLGEHIPYEALFSQYRTCLKMLAQQLPIEPILREFEKALLEELGMTIDYSLLFEQEYAYFYYYPEQGFLPIVDENANDNKNSNRYHREHLIAIAEEDFSELIVRQTYKLLMRQVLNHLLGGVQLNSRKLFKRN